MTLTQLLDGRAPTALLFDLDGTLLDSLPDLTTAVDRMLIGLGREPAGSRLVRSWIGDGARQLVREALLFTQARHPAQFDASAPAGALADGLLERALDLYMQNYAACFTERSQLFVGVREALAYWRERAIPMACVTNKSARFTEPLLDFFGLRDCLPIAVSGDTLAQRKPDAAPLLFACEQLGVDAQRAVMLGDSRNDVLAARAAGMPVICVSYGYNHGRSIVDERPDHIVDSLLDLL